MHVGKVAYKSYYMVSGWRGILENVVLKKTVSGMVGLVLR
jgi:hypothetical protein